jgi:hypothetical protein
VKETLKKLLRWLFTSVEPPDAAAAGYVRSYLGVRFFIGVLGVTLSIFLPFLLWVVDHGEPIPLDSLSVYYYSGVGEVFVAVLTTIAFFLIAYKFRNFKNPENWLSILAGVAVLAVVLFPTNRPALNEHSPNPACTQGGASECTQIQEWLGEPRVGKFHIGVAVAFILSSAMISVRFAVQERSRHRVNPGSGPWWKPGSGRWWWGNVVCTALILLGGLWILVTRVEGPIDWPRWSVFAGEVASFLGFGFAWLTKGAERETLFGRQPSRETGRPKAASCKGPQQRAR